MDLKSLIRINKIALHYFVDSLNRSISVQGYLRGRLSSMCIDRFKLGYAPRSGLIDQLRKYSVSNADAEVLGLIGLNEDGSAYEVFSNRVMIPIIHAGVLVGFGGRRLDNDQGKVKYINSKASVLYNKSSVLYGLWNSRGYILKQGYAIALEGYFDWLSLFDNNITNVVATCGTALTEEHCTMLKRYTKTVGIMLDGDAAGVKMTAKMIETARSCGLLARPIPLPDGFDPDDYLNKCGKERLLRLIGKAVG